MKYLLLINFCSITIFAFSQNSLKNNTNRNLHLIFRPQLGVHSSEPVIADELQFNFYRNYGNYKAVKQSYEPRLRGIFNYKLGLRFKNNIAFGIDQSIYWTNHNLKYKVVGVDNGSQKYQDRIMDVNYVKQYVSTGFFLGKSFPTKYFVISVLASPGLNFSINEFYDIKGKIEGVGSSSSYNDTINNSIISIIHGTPNTENESFQIQTNNKKVSFFIGGTISIPIELYPFALINKSELKKLYFLIEPSYHHYIPLQNETGTDITFSSKALTFSISYDITF